MKTIDGSMIMTEENITVKKKEYVYNKRKFAIKVFASLIASLICFVIFLNLAAYLGIVNWNAYGLIEDLKFILIIYLGYIVFKKFVKFFVTQEIHTLLVNYPELMKDEAIKYLKPLLLHRFWYLVGFVFLIELNLKLNSILF